MTRIVSVLFSCLGLLVMLILASHSIAQTVASDAPTSDKLWEVVLKLTFPALWTVASPFFTKGITWALLKVVSMVPPSVQIVISSLIGATVAGLAGAIPEFPLSIESAAQMGAAGGATGQILANLHPNAVQPVGNQADRPVAHTGS